MGELSLRGEIPRMRRERRVGAEGIADLGARALP